MIEDLFSAARAGAVRAAVACVQYVSMIDHSIRYMLCLSDSIFFAQGNLFVHGEDSGFGGVVTMRGSLTAGGT